LTEESIKRAKEMAECEKYVLTNEGELAYLDKKHLKENYADTLAEIQVADFPKNISARNRNIIIGVVVVIIKLLTLLLSLGNKK
jgi:hypothetical protein